MVTVKFSSENELVDELKRDYSSSDDKPRPMPLPHERPILRISSLAKSTFGGLTGHYLVATMVNCRGELLRLEKYCGEWLQSEDERAQENLNEVLAKIQNLCDELLIDVRGGVIEP
jgi:hypothetical protein